MKYCTHGCLILVSFYVLVTYGVQCPKEYFYKADSTKIY